MAPMTGDAPKPVLDRNNLLERILIVRPDARLEEIRRLAPLFHDVPDKQLENLVARMKQRIAKHQYRRTQRRR